MGITVPQLRKLAKTYAARADFPDYDILLDSPLHEARFTALALMVLRYASSDPKAQETLFKYYLSKTERFNNWDLVDLSAPYIAGPYLMERDRSVLFRLAKTKNLWSQRIAILSTFYFIKNNDFGTTLEIAELLLNHEHDLIHKAVGWMLREVGKKNKQTELDFLKPRYKAMPRTMLRYAIEKFPEAQRKAFLLGKA